MLFTLEWQPQHSGDPAVTLTNTLGCCNLRVSSSKPPTWQQGETFLQDWMSIAAQTRHGALQTLLTIVSTTSTHATRKPQVSPCIHLYYAWPTSLLWEMIGL